MWQDDGMEEKRNKTEDKAIRRDEKGLFLPGNPPGPGRPKGKTIKERVMDWLEEHPDDMSAFVEHFVKKNRDLAWQMLEGRPHQKEQHEGEVKLKTIIINKSDGSSED